MIINLLLWRGSRYHGGYVRKRDVPGIVNEFPFEFIAIFLRRQAYTEVRAEFVEHMGLGGIGMRLRPSQVLLFEGMVDFVSIGGFIGGRIAFLFLRCIDVNQVATQHFPRLEEEVT